MANKGIAAALIIVLGTLLRLLFIGQAPAGFNQDEASAGYEAWSLLNYGIDRNGIQFPVLFISWGSGQNVLYSYLSAPFIALFGLNEFSVRLLSALLGSLSLPVFYKLAGRVKDGGFALAALLALAVNPWHIMISRWALESNILPFFLLLALWQMVRAYSENCGRSFALAALFFALSLYAYGTAFIFLPPFLVMSGIYLAAKRAIRLRAFICAAVIFVLIALPVTLCNLLNALGAQESVIFGLTLPRLTQTRQSATTVFGGGGFFTAFSNFAGFLRLLLRQSDGLPWNSAPGFGLLYGIPGLLFALFGTGSFVYSLPKKQLRNDAELFVFFALVSSFIAAFFIDVNINRINMAFLPLIYFQARGAYVAVKLAGDAFAPVVAAAAVAACIVFSAYYFTEYQALISPHFFGGLGAAIQLASEQDPQTLWVGDEVNAPYIYVLFYNRVPPREFANSVTYLNPDGAFRWVESFANYRFGGGPPETDAVLVTKRLLEGELLGRYGEFYVIRR